MLAAIIKVLHYMECMHKGFTINFFMLVVYMQQRPIFYFVVFMVLRFFRKGQFCPVCLKVYQNPGSDSLMVCCNTCGRWIHTSKFLSSNLEYCECSEAVECI